MSQPSPERMPIEPHSHLSRSGRYGTAGRALGLVVLFVVLGLAFMGHLSPDMKLQWENLMALCGF